MHSRESRELFSKLREVGKTLPTLREFCTSKFALIIKYLPQRILESDDDLNYIFTGLSGSLDELENKTKVVDIVLEVLRKNQRSLKHCGVLISRVRLELPRLPSNAVKRWCEDSVKSIVEDTDVNMIWCDILPECLNALMLLENIEYNNTTISGREYKEQCLEVLLDRPWKKGQLVQLAAMFKDLQLTKQEHYKCVLKICTFLKDTPPDSLPPLAHQLLKLCRSYNMEVVLAHLSHYFNLQLFSKFAAVTQDSESTTMDVDDIQQYSEAELHSCMSTCILYATQDAEAICRQLRGWPRSQLTREPFLLTLGLAMADKGDEFRTKCLDVIKSAIELSEMDKIKSKESAWVRSLLPPEIVLTELVKELTNSERPQPATLTGLVYLGFALLAGGPGARLGSAVLQRLVRAHPHTVEFVLSLLADHLARDASHAHYADCLRSLCERAPLAVEPCPALVNILESCHPTTPEVLEAVSPLVNFSISRRDTLISVCRKGLYSRTSAYRRLAVCGILTVLKHLRVSGGARPDTHDTHDTYDTADDASQMSQMSQAQTADVHATQQCSVGPSTRNMTICDEMVRILQRCLGQDASVKQLLYSRWYSCVKDKQGLHETILDMLNEHLRRYLSEEADTALIDKCVQTNVSNPVLLEPIGHLLYLIAQLLGASASNEHSVVRATLMAIMADLAKCDRLATVDMEHLNLTESTPESKANCIKVQQLLQVYEALVAHHITQWSPSAGHADAVYAIYKAHNQLLENSKSPTKAAKKARKLNETQESVKSTNSRKGADKENAKKAPKAPKDKSGPFKPLPCIWDLKICYKVMELLHGSEAGRSPQQGSLRRRGVFQRWAARRVSSALLALPANAHAHAYAHAVKHVPRLAALLYARCLCRFKDLCDFDDDTALGCLEVFHACLAIYCLPKYHSHVEKLLSKITGNENVTAAENKATILSTIHANVLEAEHTNASQSAYATNRRIIKELTEIAVMLMKLPTDLHLNLSKGIRKWERYARESSSQECVSLLVQLLAEAQAESCETALLDSVLARLAAVLGGEDQDQEAPSQSTLGERGEWAWIGAGSACAVLGHVCAHAAARLACARHVLQRARDLAAAQRAAVDADKLAIERERRKMLTALTVQLCQLASCVSKLCALRGARRALELAARLYALGADFAKLLDAPRAAYVKLNNLLTLMGNPLTGAVRARCVAAGGRRKAGDARLLARLVRLAEAFRAAVLGLDRKGELNYGKYLSERLELGVRVPAGNEDNAMEQSGDDTMDVDADNSDAETHIIEEEDE